MPSSYQPQDTQQHYDEFGAREWSRLTQTPTDEVSLHIHTHYLKKHIAPGQKVLEIGAGAGRFTQVLAEIGAQIVVADLSGVQVELNRQFARQYGFAAAVLEWQQADLCDLSRFTDASFDAVVAYGGPFSYVLDQRDLALAECLRVLCPGGRLLLSVMSLWGTSHRFLEGVLALPPATNQRITTTGDLTPATFPERRSHFMHMFRVEELRAWLEAAGLHLLDISASNGLSVPWGENLAAVRLDAEKWAELLRMELEACAEPGCQGMGTHLIAVAQK